MQIFWIFCLGLLALSHNTLQASTANSTSYVGAVVEYSPVTTGSNATEIENANANNFVTMVKKAAEYETDIILFPENGLTAGLTLSSWNRSHYPSYTSFIPDPTTAHIPCNNSSTTVIEALQILSCAARDHSMYIVVNLHEKENCTGAGTASRPCPADGYFFYNSNVAFSRTGAIVARYRKYNLFGEPGLNVTASPEISTFTTDFNVTFGQFICFDLIFDEPALSLVRDYGVTDVLFSTHWFSELPYLTANQVQSAWASASNVNFLGSGYNNPATGSGGSGIYAGSNGSLVQLWPETISNSLLVARIPKVVDGRRATVSNSTLGLPLTYTFNSTEISTSNRTSSVAQQVLLRESIPWTTASLSPNTTSAYDLTLCNRNLCCSFAANTTFNATLAGGSSSGSYYRYRFAVFNGVRSFSGVATGGIQVCSVVACTDSTEDSCGSRFDANATVVHPTSFNGIVISGNFSSGNDTLQMPNSVTTEMLPLDAGNFEYSSTLVNASHKNLRFALTTGQSRLLTFAIHGRNFSGDGLNVTVASSSVTSSASAFVIASLLALVVVAANDR